MFGFPLLDGAPSCAQEVMKDLDVSPSDEPYLIRRPLNLT